ncbi:MAG TPA: lysyl oxidase family protein [Miltoncostaeaceae bacterium]|nr:lysyl oxidase family protein [Miltoncostaeaceae bacterium]
MAAALLGAGALATIGMAAGSGDEPDLVPMLPTTGKPNMRWVDSQAIPGRVLYRFDTVILNKGGAFEVYRDDGGTTHQRVWDGGAPPAGGDAKDFPAGGSYDDYAIRDGGPDGGNALRYSDAYGHKHFHSQRIAAYELVDPHGTALREASKNLAGFCLTDSWGQGYGDYQYTPCAAGEPGYGKLLRMGISRDWGDLYGSQLWDQWVDVTDVTPGTYRLRATVDPTGLYRESDEGNNTTDDQVVIPGVVAQSRTVSTAAGTPVAVPLGATVVGEGVGSRKPSCPDNQTYKPECMTTAAPGVVTLAVAQPPAGRGSVALSGTTATYTPPRGFSGAATFTYTGTDSRGLTSAPATVTVTVRSAAGGSSKTGRAAGGGGSTPAKFTLSARQLLINQRIGQAAIRRLAAVQAKLDGKPAPRFPNSGKDAGAVRLTAGQLLINQRIYQAAIRRASTLEARLDSKPAPTFGSRKGGTVTFTVRQLRVNQRIAQAAVRRANALVARVS